MVCPRYSPDPIASAIAPFPRLSAVGDDAAPEGGVAAICSSSVLRSAEAALAAADAWGGGGMDTASSSALVSGAADWGTLSDCGGCGAARGWAACDAG